MPRVPIVNGPSVMPDQPYGATAPAQVRPDTSAVGLIQDAGQTLNAAVGAGVHQARLHDKQVADAAAKAAKEGDALAQADAMLELDNRFLKRREQFLQLRGLDASAASAGVISSLDKDREEIAQSLGSPEARARFLTRSAESLMAYHRQVESHVSSQFEVARDATVKARMQQALGAAQSTDFQGWRTLSNEVERDIHANARSPEEGDALAAAFRADSAAEYAKGLLADGRTEEATTFVEENRKVLAGNYARTKAAVTQAKAKLELTQAKDAADAKAVEVVRAATDLNSMPDIQQLEEKLAQLPEKGHEHDALQSRLSDAQRFRTAKLQGWWNDAFQATNAGHPIDAGTEQMLQKYDAAKWRAYQQQLVDRARANKAHRANSSLQKGVDREAENEYRAALNDNPDLSADDFALDFSARKAASGRPAAVSDEGLSRLHLLGSDRRTKAGAAAEKTMTADQRRLEAARRRDADAFAQALRNQTKVKGRNFDEADVARRKGEYLEKYDEAVQRNGGKPLDAKQVSDLVNQGLSKAVLDPGTKVGPFTFGQKTGLGVDTFSGGPVEGARTNKKKYQIKGGRLVPVGE
jgi:hypothetical protein